MSLRGQDMHGSSQICLSKLLLARETGVRCWALCDPSTSRHSYSEKVDSELNTWVECDFLHHCSAQYAELARTPRSTIAAAFSYDGQAIASTHGDHTVKVVDCSTGSTRAVLDGHLRTPWVVRFNPAKPTVLASGSLDHVVIVWEAESGQQLLSHNFGKPIASVAFHSEGNIMAVASGHKVYTWHYNSAGQPHSPEVVLKTRKSLRALHFHPLGRPLILSAEVVERRSTNPDHDPAALASAAVAAAREDVAAEAALAFESLWRHRQVPPVPMPFSPPSPPSEQHAQPSLPPEALDIAWMTRQVGGSSHEHTRNVTQQAMPADGPSSHLQASRIPASELSNHAHQHTQIVSTAEGVSAAEAHDGDVLMEPPPSILPTFESTTVSDGVVFDYFNTIAPQHMQHVMASQQHGNPAQQNRDAFRQEIERRLANIPPSNATVITRQEATNALIADIRDAAADSSTATNRHQPADGSQGPITNPTAVVPSTQTDAGAAQGAERARLRTPELNAAAQQYRILSDIELIIQSLNNTQDSMLREQWLTHLVERRIALGIASGRTDPAASLATSSNHSQPPAQLPVLQSSGAMPSHAGSLGIVNGIPITSIPGTAQWRPDVVWSRLSTPLLPLMPSTAEEEAHQDTFDINWGWEVSASSQEQQAARQQRTVQIQRQLPLPSVQEQPCIVNLMIWPFDIKAAGKHLHRPVLQLPRTVLCSEMGASFSRCGRYLAVCVQTDTPSNACLSWSQKRRAANATRKLVGDNTSNSSKAMWLKPPAWLGERPVVDRTPAGYQEQLHWRSEYQRHRRLQMESSAPSISDIQNLLQQILKHASSTPPVAGQLAPFNSGEGSATALVLAWYAGLQHYVTAMRALVVRCSQSLVAVPHPGLAAILPALREVSARVDSVFYSVLQQHAGHESLLQVLGQETGSTASSQTAQDQQGREMQPLISSIRHAMSVVSRQEGGQAASSFMHVGESSLTGQPAANPSAALESQSNASGIVDAAAQGTEQNVGGKSAAGAQASATTTQTKSTAPTYELRVYSMDGPTFGKVLHARPIHAAHCLTSIQFSPTSQHLLVAYGRRHVHLCSLLAAEGQITPLHTVVEIYRVGDMRMVRHLVALDDEVNVATWHPTPGGGIAYGTKEGKLRIFRHDRRDPVRSSIPMSMGEPTMADEVRQPEGNGGQQEPASDEDA